MPIELNPRPGQYGYQNPYLHYSIPAHYPTRIHIPRAVQIEPPGPGKCLPNGRINPYPAYGGESYIPSSQGMANRQIHSHSGQINTIYPSILPSVICPAGVVASNHQMYPGLGGSRSDDGWNGSIGRHHMGVSPDMTSTAGAIPRAPSSWYNSPSSPAKHVALTPALSLHPPPSMVSHSVPEPSHRPRRNSIRAVPIHHQQEGCAECQAQAHSTHSGQPGQSRSRSASLGEYEQGQAYHRRTLHISATAGSPLRGSPGTILQRNINMGKSHRSSRTSGSPSCAECAK